MREAVDVPPVIGSTIGFQAAIVPSSVSKMKLAGALTVPAEITKSAVRFRTIPVAAAGGWGGRPGGSGIVTVKLVFTPLPS
jgi:hypothetical protein